MIIFKVNNNMLIDNNIYKITFSNVFLKHINLQCFTAVHYSNNYTIDIGLFSTLLKIIKH